MAGGTEHETIVMGVLNVTPDSFSDGGRFATAATAISRGRALIEQGAQIVDVGGESTRPGAEPVPLLEEQRRVLPVVRALASDGIDVSIDTIHAETAAEAVALGARFINDVSGGTHDPDMLRVAAEASQSHGVRFVIGHWRGVPDPGEQRSAYTDVVAEVRDELEHLANRALAAGVASEHIVLDPGLGFDKTGPQSWQLLAHLEAFTGLGYPVLVGASRKRMTAEVLSAIPAAARSRHGAESHERDLVTSVSSAFAAQLGVWGVRVHDVAGSVQALAVESAWRAGGPETENASLARQPLASPSKTPQRETPADRITLTGLEVIAHHGVFDRERENGQRFLIDAELELDLRAAASGDELARTVHYGELAEALQAAIVRDPVDLIETVAERLAAVALGFAGVQTARITVHKPDAPINAVFSDVSVTVTRAAGRSEQERS